MPFVRTLGVMRAIMNSILPKKPNTASSKTASIVRSVGLRIFLNPHKPEKGSQMKLDEVFDSNYYDFLQDEMARKKHDPFEDDPQESGETSMEDFIISKFETGKISFEDAKKELKKQTTTELEYHFWRMELVMAAELLDDNQTNPNFS